MFKEGGCWGGGGGGGGHRPINWMKSFENEIDKTKKLVVNKVQLYPLSSLFFNFFLRKQKKEKERTKAGGPYFQQGSFTNA